jgi:hypothetical protein
LYKEEEICAVKRGKKMEIRGGELVRERKGDRARRKR